MPATAPHADDALGPRARRSALRRREILDAASSTIARRGYAGATLAAIAEEGGVSAPRLLHHFRPKEHLLTELLAHRDEVSRGEGEDSFDAGGQALLAHLADTAAKNAREEGLTRLYAVLLGEALTEGHPARDFFHDRFEGLRTPVRDAMLEVIADPDVSEDDALEAAAAVVAVMDGLQYQHLLSPGTVDMEAVVRRTIRALLADLRRGSDSSER